MASLTPVGLGLVVLSAVGGLLTIAIGYLTLERGASDPAAQRFASLLFAVGGWGLTYALMLLSPVRWMVLTLDTLKLGVALATAFTWFLFVLEYTGHGEWITEPREKAIWGQTGLFLLLYATNPVHHLVSETQLFKQNGLTMLVAKPKLLMLVELVLVFGAIALSYVLLGRYVVSSQDTARTQSLVVFSATLVGLGVLLFGPALVDSATPYGNFDPTPVAFTLLGGIVAWVLLQTGDDAIPSLGANSTVED
jgi:hypothetical protein